MVILRNNTPRDTMQSGVCFFRCQCLIRHITDLDIELAHALEQYASRLEPSIIQVPLPPETNDPISTPFDLSQSYYKRLEGEFNRVKQVFAKRAATVKSITKDIVSLYGELGLSSSQIDQSIIDFGATEPERLGLTMDDIERLKGKKEKLLAEILKRQTQVNDLKNEIVELWEKLGVETEEQDSFLSQHRGCDPRTIHGVSATKKNQKPKIITDRLDNCSWKQS